MKCAASFTFVNILDGIDAVTYVNLTSGYDLNNAKNKDTVYVSSSTAICASLLNKPVNFIAGEVRIEVKWLGSSSYITQFMTCKAGNDVKYFTRTYSVGTWGSWIVQSQNGASGDKGDKGDKGDVGAPAIVFDLITDKTTYTINKRATAEQKVLFKAVKQNVSGTVKWSVPIGYQAIDGDSLTLIIPPTETNENLSVTAYIPNTKYSKTIVLVGVAVVNKPIYLGLLVSAPTGGVIKGDYYLNGSLKADGTNTDTTLIPFVYDGVSWKKIDDTTLALSEGQVSEIFSAILKDAGEFLISNPNAKTPQNYAYFKRLITEYITADFVSALEIKLRSGGKIESSNFYYNYQINNGDKKLYTPKGFRFLDTGEAWVTDLQAQNLNAKNSTIEGNISSKALETVDRVPSISAADKLIDTWNMNASNTFNVSTQGEILPNYYYPRNWHAVAYGAGKYVAVGENKQVGVYQNGTWTFSEQSNGDWNAIAYGEGRFVAVGQAGQVGIYENNTWTISRLNTPRAFYGVAYGEGKFLAVGVQQVAIYQNGTWTLTEQPDVQWNCVAYGDDVSLSGAIFMVAGNNGKAGIYQNNNWLFISQGSSNFYSISYGSIWDDNRFIVVGAGGIAFTYDTFFWTPLTVDARTWFGVACGDNKFISVGQWAQIGSCKDGKWIISEQGTDFWRGICYGDGRFVAVGNKGQIGITDYNFDNAIDYLANLSNEQIDFKEILEHPLGLLQRVSGTLNKGNSLVANITKMQVVQSQMYMEMDNGLTYTINYNGNSVDKYSIKNLVIKETEESVEFNLLLPRVIDGVVQRSQIGRRGKEIEEIYGKEVWGAVWN